MPPVEVVFILAFLAVVGNVLVLRGGIMIPTTYYIWLAFGCLIVACFYLYLIFTPEAPLATRSLIARWGYINLFIPMCYPIIFIAAKKIWG